MTVTLPPNQRKIFDKLGREFDNREYAKAIRSADAILSVIPEHADTLAMKGLTLHSMDKKEEGMALLKESIALSVNSTVAWHSLGMCYRADKNYLEALKAFKRAHNTDPTNINVLRDISSLHIQFRDWNSFLSVREKMVSIQPSVKANWIALACGHHMLGSHALASGVLETMEAVVPLSEVPYERSEFFLFHAELLLASGEPSRAMEILRHHDADIIDDEAKKKVRAKAHALMGQKAEAEKWYMSLISMGIADGENIAAIAHLRKIPLDHQNRPKRDFDKYVALLTDVLKVAPRSDYAKRQMLDFVPMDRFKSALEEFSLGYLKRLVPNLFSVFQSLYGDPERTKVIGEVFEAWEKSLLDNDFSFCDNDNSPAYLLWVLAFLASHYNRLGDYERAHSYVDRAIHHTPTVEILYLIRAEIYANENKSADAAASADFARSLDLQDKYLNSEAAKYHFRNNDIEKGEATMQLFYEKSPIPGDSYLIALESQCAWYEKEVADAFYRLGDYYSALQNYLMLERHHLHNHQELLEFHNYVFRRGTMRQWLDTIAWDDQMEKNRFFLDICPGIIRTYFQVHALGADEVRARHVPRTLPSSPDHPERTKRLEQLFRDYYIQDIDLSEPLEKAERYVRALLQHRAHETQTHILAIELYEALNAPLLVARSLRALSKLKYPSIEQVRQKFQTGMLERTKATLDSRVLSVIEELIQA